MFVEEISLPIQRVLEQLRQGEPLSEEQLDLLLTPAEVEAVLSWKKGSKVSRRYIGQLIRGGRLEPSYRGGGGAYRYQLRAVLAIQLYANRGRPKQDKLGAMTP